MADKNKAPMYGVGIVSIFMIFAVLCLMTFALLSISSAKADLRLSEKNAQYVAGYYSLTGYGSEVIDATVQLWQGEERPAVETVQNAITAQQDGERSIVSQSVTQTDDGLAISFTVKLAGSESTLSVGYTLNPPQAERRCDFDNYTFLSADNTEQIDWGLPVWQDVGD